MLLHFVRGHLIANVGTPPRNTSRKSFLLLLPVVFCLEAVPESGGSSDRTLDKAGHLANDSGIIRGLCGVDFHVGSLELLERSTLF